MKKEEDYIYSMQKAYYFFDLCDIINLYLKRWSMETFTTYFLLFIIYSFLGWLMEVICKLFELKRFVNRGFLIGPICPIYGYGVIGILLLIGTDTKDFLGVFLKSILICSVLEYFTSYIMEKLFKARWWDYSKRKFNINGRICLETMIPFGILGTSIVYFINPFFMKLVNMISPKVRLILTIILLVIYIIDNAVSFNIMNKIKGEIKKHHKDNTEAIKKKVSEWLENNTILYRHIKDSYPKFKILKKKEKVENGKDI